MQQSIPQNVALQEADPEIHELIKKEKRRQINGIELIASEVSYYHFRAFVCHCKGTVRPSPHKFELITDSASPFAEFYFEGSSRCSGILLHQQVL